MAALIGKRPVQDEYAEVKISTGTKLLADCSDKMVEH
jgi:hypothetical protein